MVILKDTKVGFVPNNEKVQLELQEVQPFTSASGADPDLLNQLNIYRNKQVLTHYTAALIHVHENCFAQIIKMDDLPTYQPTL